MSSNLPLSDPIFYPATTADEPLNFFYPLNIAQSSNISPWNSNLYTIDQPRSRSPSLSPLLPPPPPPPPPPVKVEPNDPDDCFIMELAAPPSADAAAYQALVPPTEVPLRATQASKEMRKMMGVFRLNPFAMHSAGRSAVPSCWYGGDARPLEEEPLVFEFQLDLDDDEQEEELEELEEEYIEDEEPSSEFSTAYDVDVNVDADADHSIDDTEPTEWYNSSPEESLFESQLLSPTWDLDYLPLDNYLPVRRSARLHNAAAHPYARRNPSTSSSSSSSSSTAALREYEYDYKYEHGHEHGHGHGHGHEPAVMNMNMNMNMGIPMSMSLPMSVPTMPITYPTRHVHVPAVELNRMRMRRASGAVDSSWSSGMYIPGFGPSQPHTHTQLAIPQSHSQFHSHSHSHPHSHSQRQTHFGVNPSGCDSQMGMMASMSLPAMARRWSMPSANPQAPFLM